MWGGGACDGGGGAARVTTHEIVALFAGWSDMSPAGKATSSATTGSCTSSHELLKGEIKVSTNSNQKFRGGGDYNGENA